MQGRMVLCLRREMNTCDCDDYDDDADVEMSEDEDFDDMFVYEIYSDRDFDVLDSRNDFDNIPTHVIANRGNGSLPWSYISHKVLCLCLGFVIGVLVYDY